MLLLEEGSKPSMKTHAVPIIVKTQIKHPIIAISELDFQLAVWNKRKYWLVVTEVSGNISNLGWQNTCQ